MLFETIACKEALYSKYDFKKSLFFFYEPCLILCWVYLTSNAIETPETTLKQPKIYQRYSYRVINYDWYKKNLHSIKTIGSKTFFLLSVCWILLEIYSTWLRRVRKHNLTLIWKYCTALLCIIAWKSLNNLKNLDYLGLLGQILVIQLINLCCNTKKGKSSALWSWIVNNDVKIKIWYILRFP